MNYPISEHVYSINGVSGRMFTIHAPQEVRGNMVLRNQTWKSEARTVKGYGTGGKMTVRLRFDDGCQNGHMTFSITADVYTDESRRCGDIAAGGCMHEEIAKRFPELAPLIKWHLVSTDGPLHYVANTIYHAGDRDCNGLRKGEVKQLRNGKSGLPSWTLQLVGEKPAQYVDSETPPPAPDAHYVYVPRTRTGEGKDRDLEAARDSACWPEATDEELSADKETLTAALQARLPALLAAFRADMERIGFIWM